MKRRDFLKYSLYTSMMTGGAAALLPGAAGAQAAPYTPYGRTLIHVMLLGGADLRFLFVPDPVAAPEYAARFWEARQSIYQYNAANTALYPDYNAVFAGQYTAATDGATSFGINNNATWLKDQFDLGNVAIVANVLGSANRRHDHSQLIVQTGDPQASQYVYDREGWGGRLAYGMSDANAVAVSNDISIFCNGIDPNNRNARVVHARDTRNFGFSEGDSDPGSDNSVMARALKTYYAQKQIEAETQPANWHYHKFLQHEQALRGFGNAFNARLAQAAPIQPPSLSALYTDGSGNTLNSSNFGRQCANVYDSFLGADLFQQRIVSMEYTGWDTHRLEKSGFESNIVDIFGAGKGIATLTAELEPLGANDDIVYVFNTDFGRQLRANGDFGTDHGRGNYTILVGRSVNGGVYGEMFPESEIQGAAGSTRFDEQGADIEGRTSLERVMSAACDWTEAGTGLQVFPNAPLSLLEPGVDLSGLLKA